MTKDIHNSQILNYRKKPHKEILRKTFNHIFEIYKRINVTELSSLSYFLLDFRYKKNHFDGLFARSYFVELQGDINETINKLIEDFIELRSQIHFVFLIDNHGPVDKSMYSFLGSNALSTSKIVSSFVENLTANGFMHMSILDGGFKVRLLTRMNSANLQFVGTTCSSTKKWIGYFKS